MNKISPVISGLLVIAVGVLYYLHFSGKKDEVKTDPAVAANRDSVSRNLTMVYVNIDTLLDNYKYVKETERELEAKRNTMVAQISSKTSQLESELGDKVIAFQKKGQAFNEKMDGMSEAIYQIKLQQLQEEERALQQEQFDAQQTIVQLKETLGAKFAEEEAKMNQAVQKEIMAYLEEYNKEHNYTFIVAKGTGSGVLLAHDALDITADILNGLNKEYEEKQKEKKK